jgi:hypothetical protein
LTDLIQGVSYLERYFLINIVKMRRKHPFSTPKNNATDARDENREETNYYNLIVISYYYIAFFSRIIYGLIFNFSQTIEDIQEEFHRSPTPFGIRERPSIKYNDADDSIITKLNFDEGSNDF